MSDDLIKRLRERGGRIPTEAADRIVTLTHEKDMLGEMLRGAEKAIEALGRERDEANGWVTMIRDERDTAIRQRNSWQDEAEAAEARLAKAVEALQDMCAEFRGYDLPYGSKAYAKATATLAELEAKTQ